jgi:hypothetical protein
VTGTTHRARYRIKRAPPFWIRGAVRDLFGGMAVRAERDAHAAVDGALYKPIVRRVSVRDLECNASGEERLDHPLLAFLGPQLIDRTLAERQCDECRVGENVHRHLASQCFERVEVRPHVFVHRDRWRPPRKGVDQVARRQTDGVQRSEAMREARDEIVGKLTPE